uniref:Putative secreted protein n=1 Tax=Rhipicephalus microplus TaxID=6941 RepID=A0A6G5A3Y6_RHIMP
MYKLFSVLLLLALAFTPSYSQDLILEEVGEYFEIINWEDFLNPGTDNPEIEVIIPPPEEQEGAGNVDVEVELGGEEGEVSENGETGENGENGEVTETTEVEVEAEEIEVVVIEFDRLLLDKGFLA